MTAPTNGWVGPSKRWGKGEFWGLSSDYDPDWGLSERQKRLRDDLIEVCRLKIRPHAVHCDQTYTFPRESLDALASLGLLGLIVPQKLGGLGETHQCAAMITETLARYGCPSTAMVFTMHLAATSVLLLRHHGNKHITDLLQRLDKERLVGTLSYSDPATGGHFWFPLSSKSRFVDEHSIKLLKYGSWATSAGCADWYAIQTVSPEFKRNYADTTCFLIYKDEIRANTDDWQALGMHGNQSGPMIVEGTFSTDRLIGPYGDGIRSNDECVDPFFLLCSSACWSGIALACIDLTKKHVTRKAHADMGMRVCDYPTIQDYFGEVVSSTNAVRSMCFLVAQALDSATENNNWDKHRDLDHLPRSKLLHWLWQLKFCAARNVGEVSDTMLHACGGSGYKTDLGLERLLRDAKAGWVMGPSNEVLRQYIGNSSLLGLEAIDYWERKPNERKIHHELGKMSVTQKKKLVEQLSAEVALEESGTCPNHPHQDQDFENPFHTVPPTYSNAALTAPDGKQHAAALNPNSWTKLKLFSRSDVTDKMAAFVFELPNPTDFTGLLPGQYLEIKAVVDGKPHTRYFSPTSPPQHVGRVELVMRFETSGIMSKFFVSLKPGDLVEFRGPCGGFEYVPRSLSVLTILASGGGITPGLQLIRSIMEDTEDTTRVKLVYYSDNYDEILYREELDDYAARDERLSIDHTLGEVPENWEGGEGFIDTALLDAAVDRTVPSHKHKIVLCGGPTMVVSCLQSLRSLGVSSDQIFVYGQFGAEQMRLVYGPFVKLATHRSDLVL